MRELSVIIPVYNTEKYLEACLDSVMQQEEVDFEVIAINDGSTDGSLDILNKFHAKYPERFKVYSENNSGQGVARNWGIKLAEGEYVGFVDSDDVIQSGMFRNMLNVARKDNCDYVECDYAYVEENNGEVVRLKKYASVGRYYSVHEMFKNPLVSPWNKIYRTEILRNNGVLFTEGRIYEDTAFFVKAIPFIERMGFVDEEYVIHYKRSGSTVNAKRDYKKEDIFYVLNDMLSFYKTKELYDQYSSELEYFYARILLCSSLIRISAINDCDLRKKMIDKTITSLRENAPMYKKNRLVKQAGKVGVYMRSVNKHNIGLVCALLRVIKK